MKRNIIALDRTAKSFFIVAIIIVAFYFFGSVLMPIIFAGMVSMLLLPVVSFLERKKVNSTLAVVISVVTLIIIALGILFVIFIESQDIVIQLPKLMEENKGMSNFSSGAWLPSSIQSFFESNSEVIKENLKSMKGALLTVFKTGVTGIKGLFVFLFTCPIYIFFMLLYRNNVYRFIKEFQRQRRSGNESEKIIDEVKQSLLQYLKGLLLVMLVVGSLTTIGLLCLGIKYALFLGLLTAFLTPIPYIGVIVSATLPVILAFLTKDSMWYSVGVIGVYALVQFLEGNFITPRVMGSNVNINPLIIIIGLVVIGSVTGFLGLVLTVPLLAITKVIIGHFPQLKPWSYLFEDNKS